MKKGFGALLILFILLSATVGVSVMWRYSQHTVRKEVDREDVMRSQKTGLPDVSPPSPPGTPMGVSTRGKLGWSEDIELTNSSFYDSEKPVVAVWGDFVHVAYQDYWSYGGFDTRVEVRYVRSVDGGRTWSEPLNVSAVDDQYSKAPDIACWENNVYIVWSDTRDNNVPEVWINISHDNGKTWTGEFNLSKIDGNWSNWPHIAVDKNTVVVVWGDDRDHPEEGSRSVYMRVSQDNGTTWGPEIRVTNITDIDWRYDDIPTQVLVNGTNVYLVFDRFFNDTGYAETMFMKSTDLGQTWTTPVLLSQHDGYNSYSGGLAVYDTWVFVVWENASAEDEIYLRRSPDLGDAWFSEQRLTWDSNESGVPRVCVDSFGNVFVVFADARGGSTQIWLMESEDFGENWSTPIQLTNSTGFSTSPDMIISDNIKHLVFYSDRTGTDEVYYKRSPPFPPPGSIPLTNGYNYLALPSYLGDIRVGDLAAMIERDTGGTVPEIVWYRSNHWEQWVKAIGGTNNVSVDHHLGYLVHVENLSGIAYWTPNGTNYSAPLSLDLWVGWNMIPVPYANNTLYASDILSQNPHIIAVADWDEQKQTYRIYNGSNSSMDFRIQENTLGVVYPTTWNANNLFILCDDYTTWTPA